MINISTYDTNKKNMVQNKFLQHPTQPIKVYPKKKISQLTNEMLTTGFQGRKLAEAIEIWAKMLKRKDIVVWMGLAGAMIPAGMRKIISYFIQRRMIDVLVSTGANLYHDCCEALGVKHYIGTHLIDDTRLRKHKVDRIYDVFGDERKFYETDRIITNEFCLLLKDNYPYSSREVLYLLGKFLSEKAKEKDSILVSAFRNNVPIFCPALNDSSIGFSIMFANRRRNEKIIKIDGKEVVLKKRRIIVDQMKDVDESSRITEKAKQTGVVIIGGGVPKNFIQQTAIVSSYQTRHDKAHKFAIQICTDVPEWGGLSGATLEEAQSWGKYSPNAKKVNCYVDATVALPIISHALSERFEQMTRNVPIFHFTNGNLKIEYKKMKL
jgi:deoxyhypusine synthase